jgi:hypothetical protein
MNYQQNDNFTRRFAQKVLAILKQMRYNFTHVMAFDFRRQFNSCFNSSHDISNQF